MSRHICIRCLDTSHEGTVEDLNLRYTTLRTYDGVHVLLPNGHVLQNPLTNLTVNGSRRTDIAIGVAYGTDLEQARAHRSGHRHRRHRP